MAIAVVAVLFICFLLALGYFINGKALAFTVQSLVALGALSFVVIVGAMAWTLSNSSESATNTASYVAPTTQPDPFPFYDDSQQYAWYDRHDVGMAYRCYTTMTTPCSSLEWQQALGVTLTPEQQQTINVQWCQKFAAEWNQTVEQCIASFTSSEPLDQGWGWNP